MRAMEVRLNIYFSHAVGKTKGKQSGRETTRGNLSISEDDSATGSRSHCF